MVADVVPGLALVALLATAYRHPRAWVEALVAALAAGAVLLAGALDRDAIDAEREHLVPVVLFLMAVLVVAECCRGAGLFTALGSRVAGARSPVALLGWVFGAAALVTVTLSLDATVVLVTPVVLVAAAGLGTSARPFQLACVRLANTSSLLLPVSNLTSLLALPALDISFGRFALLMAPVWVLVLAVEWVAHRWWFRTELADAAQRPAVGVAPVPMVPLLVVAAMLAGFVVGSAYDVDPAWIAGAAALALVLRGLARRELGLPQVVASAHPAFALFVLALGLVVAALGDRWLGDALARLVPDSGGLGAMLLLAGLGVVLANLVNNLPATLLLAPLAAPLGTEAVLAVLVGINVGSALTWTGSLANLLWRRSVARTGGTVDSRDFHLVGLLVTPPAVLGGVLVLHLTAALV